MSELVTVNATTEPMVVTSRSCKSNSLTNAMGNALKQIKENRRLRHTQFPSLKGSYGWDLFIGNMDMNNDFSRRNGDEKSVQPLAPHRIYDSLSDPTSGFLSVGCDDSHSKIKPVLHLNHTPQSMTSQGQIERYSTLEAPFQLRRQSTWCPGCPTAWNSHKASDVWVRAKIRGWISDVGTSRIKDTTRLSQTAMMREQDQNTKDKLALKYIYGTSTQRGYEDVPWDSMLRPKQHPPTLAGEEISDIVLYHRNKKLCNPTIQECQIVAYSSVQCLSPEGPATLSYLGNQTQQFPFHSGSVGAKRCAEAETIEPKNMRISSGFLPKQEAQEFLSGRPHSDYRRKSRMSKMVTIVPPYNPFNTMEKVPVLV